MKKDFVIILFFLFTTATFAINANDFSVVPSLAWSGTNFLNFKNGQAFSAIKHSELYQFVDIFLGSTKRNTIFQNYFSYHGEPVVVVVFVLPEQISDTLFIHSSQYLQTIFESSVSSLSIPYTQTELLSVDNLSIKFINNLSTKVKKILVANKLGKLIPNSKIIKVISLESILQRGDTNIFENGIPELFIVSLDSENLGIVESIIQKVNTAVNQSMNGKFVNFLTFTSSMYETLDRTVFAFPEFTQLATSSQYNNNTYVFNLADFWPGYILQGIIVCFIALFIFLVGFCCMFAIQTPKSFEEPKGHIQ